MSPLALPFRLGATSYVIPDDILANARHLAGSVDDVELLLFEADDDGGNLPAPETIRELAALATSQGLSYTVHLPLDLRLADGGSEGDGSLLRAGEVIARTRLLDPRAYVIHLDGKRLLEAQTSGCLSGPALAAARARWRDETARGLEALAALAGGPGLIAVENLEGYPPDFNDPVLEVLPVSRCVDVGHLWLDGHDPVPYLAAALPRTTVIHIHGIQERDHKSLAQVPEARLRAVLSLLLEAKYAGVLTVEVFSAEDLETSVAALRQAMRSPWASA
jgi:sugar phosphate isomerase/epimerase